MENKRFDFLKQWHSVNQFRSRKRAHHGLTLVEILIVVVVLGILMSLTLVSYRERRMRTRYDTALNIVKMIIAAENDYLVYQMTGYYEPTTNTADTNAKLGLNIVNDDFRNFAVQTNGVSPGDDFTISFSSSECGTYVFDSSFNRVDCIGYCP